MINNKDFTGRIEFRYSKTEESDRTSWNQSHYDGGIEVVVPEQNIIGIYGQQYTIPEHTKLIPFTEGEYKQLKSIYDRIKNRVKSELNK